MYELYFKKKEVVLQIQPLENMRAGRLVGNVPVQWNDCFWICNNRKVLKELASQMQSEWIKEGEEELQKLREMKIISKYK